MSVSGTAGNKGPISSVFIKEKYHVSPFYPITARCLYSSFLLKSETCLFPTNFVKWNLFHGIILDYIVIISNTERSFIPLTQFSSMIFFPRTLVVITSSMVTLIKTRTIPINTSAPCVAKMFTLENWVYIS
jgi:hypothetical protein